MNKLYITGLLIACGATESDTAETADPPECRESSAYTSGTRFQESTDDAPLALSSDYRGLRMSTADLNQDGYPDLVISQIGTHKHNDYAPEGKIQRRLLMNRGGKTWEDVSESSGLFRNRSGEPGHAAAIHIFGDVDNDGDLDVFSGVYTDQSRDDDPLDRSMIHLNNGEAVFTAAEASEISIEKGYATVAASFVDFNADGNLDLWVVGFYKQYGASYAAEQDQLFEGLGDGRFEDVTKKMGLKMKASGDVARWIDGTGRRPGYGATACEVTGDGKVDLIASNYARTWNQIWAQTESGFEDIGMASGFAGDSNQDYSDNEFYRCYCQSNTCNPAPPAPVVSCGNYWNAGFDDTPARLNGNSFSTACGDVDADGDMDLLTAEIVHWHIGQSSDPTELLLNDGTGQFTRPGNEKMGLARSWPSSSWNEGDITAAFFDFDNDGYQDILIGSSDYPDTHIFLYAQQEDGTFEDVSKQTGMNQPWPAGLAIADFDADGDLDVISGSSTARTGTPWEDRRLHFYENLSSGNAARLNLRGTTNNGAGIGAEVRIQTGNRTQRFDVSGGYGHFGLHNTTGINAGLGEACRFDAEVTWPTGAVDNWTGLAANVDWILEEGGSAQRRE
jgi:hypothetical protein